MFSVTFHHCSLWMYEQQLFSLRIWNPNISLCQWKLPFSRVEKVVFRPVVCACTRNKDCNILLVSAPHKKHSIKIFIMYSGSYSFTNIPMLVFSQVMCCILLETKMLSKHPLKLLVLQGNNIWSVCQIKLQRFALVRKTTLVTAVFWLLWLTYKSLWPQGLAGCSLTLSLHNPSSLLLFFSSPLCPCMFLCIWAQTKKHVWFSTWISPWRLKNSQKQSRQAGRSGLDMAARLRPLVQTLWSLVHRTVSAG